MLASRWHASSVFTRRHVVLAPILVHEMSSSVQGLRGNMECHGHIGADGKRSTPTTSCISEYRATTRIKYHRSKAIGNTTSSKEKVWGRNFEFGKVENMGIMKLYSWTQRNYSGICLDTLENHEKPRQSSRPSLIKGTHGSYIVSFFKSTSSACLVSLSKQMVGTNNKPHPVVLLMTMIQLFC